MTQPQTDKLYDHHRQQLSAMLDGELSPDEAKFMLRRLQHDGELATCWERWQVCGDVLRGRHEALLPADFSQRVAQAIADPSTASRQEMGASSPGSRSRATRWVRWGGGAALAASVAMLALIVGRETSAPDAGRTEQPAPLASESGSPPVTLPERGPSTMPESPALETGSPVPLAAAATAVVVADVPRRVAERRSRGQSQRAATRLRREADAPMQIAVNAAPRAAAAATDALRTAASAGQADRQLVTGSRVAGFSDPFAAQPAAGSRQWPRAILPGFRTNDALTASYDETASAASRFHPFEPRVDLSSVEPDSDAAATSGPR